MIHCWYKGHCSSTQCVNLWSPTGFYSRTLLFFIYVNDIFDVSKELEFISFANDTYVSFSHKNFNFLMLKMNFELIKLTSWFQANRLSINIGKTQYKRGKRMII